MCVYHTWFKVNFNLFTHVCPYGFKALADSRHSPLWILVLCNILQTYLLQIAHPSTCASPLTHQGRVMHICVSKLTILGSDNGFAPSRRQAIIWTKDGILLNQNLSEIFSEINTLSFKKMHLKCRLVNVVHFVSASVCCRIELPCSQERDYF